MQRKSLVVLIAATAIMVVLAIASIATANRGATRAAGNERMFPGLAAKLSDVTTVALSRPDLKATFTREGDIWRVAEKANYPAAASKVTQAVLALADLTLVEAKTEKPENYPRLEVEDAGKGKSTLMTVKDKSGGTLAELLVGKRRYDRLGAGNDGVYVRKPGEAQAWLARGSLDLSGDISGWLDRRILDVSEKRVASLTVTQPDGGKLTISRPAAGGKFAVATPPANAKFKSDAATAEPATGLETLDFNDVRPAKDSPVPDTGVTAAAYQTFDGLTVTLRLVEREGGNWVAINAAGTGEAEAEAKKLNDKLGNWTFSVPTYKANMFKTKLADLLEPPAAPAPKS